MRFPQGGSTVRPDPVYMEAPDDPILQAAGAFGSESGLYEVIGNIYGLVTAPWDWFQDASNRMRSVKYIHHSLDACCFVKREKGKLVMLLIFHVDDFLFTWHPDYDIAELKGLFTWGKWEVLKPGDPASTLVFVGREVRQLLTGDIRVTQQSFLVNTPEGKVGTKLDEPLTGPQITELRSCIGSLQCLSGNCRLDLAADTSLCQRKEPTGQDLADVFSTLRYAKLTADVGITLSAAVAR